MLGHNAVAALPAGFGAAAGALPRLTTLYLTGNALTALPAGFGSALPKLEYLFLENNALAADARPGADAAAWPALKHAYLHGNAALCAAPGGGNASAWGKGVASCGAQCNPAGGWEACYAHCVCDGAHGCEGANPYKHGARHGDAAHARCDTGACAALKGVQQCAADNN